MSKRELPPGFVVPAQPVERTVPPSGPGWVHEIKHDGYRLIVRKSGGFVQLFTRNGTDYSARLLAIAASARSLAGAFVLDGEAVVVGPDGLSLFDALRRRDAADKAVLFAFDLLERNGTDLRGYPLEARKQMLDKLPRGGGASAEAICEAVTRPYIRPWRPLSQTWATRVSFKDEFSTRCGARVPTSGT